MSKSVYSVVSGKGGTGKTTVSVNLAITLHKNFGKSVLLVDTDFLLPSVGVFMGLNPKEDLFGFINKGFDSDKAPDYITKTKYGIDVMAGISAAGKKTEIPYTKLMPFAEGVAKLPYDCVIFDVGAGIHKPLFAFSKVATRVLVVTVPEPAAMIDAYKSMRTLNMQSSDTEFRVIFNRMMGKQNTEQTIHNFVNLLQRKVSDDVEFLDIIPFDVNVVNAGIKQKPLVEGKESPAVVVLNRIAEKLIEEEKL